MPEQTHSTPMRVRIYSHVTQSRFLHIGDALSLHKLRLFAGTYRRGAGMSTHTAHFLDVADARVLFGALADGRDGFQYREYKGTPEQKDSAAESRVLSVSVKGEKVYIELKAGPGKETATGAITPAGPARVEVNVSFSRHEAQRLALAVLAYLQAWEVVRMMTHRQQVGSIRPYELVPAGSGREQAAQNGAGGAVYGPQAAGPEAPPARPVTRKGVAAGNGAPHKRDVANGRTGAAKRESASPVPAGPPPPPVLTYGDGSQVDADNVTEVQTFMMYQEEKKGVPADRSALLAYYQERARLVQG